MSKIAIRAENLGKHYRIAKRQERYYTMRDTLTDFFIAPFRRTAKLLKGQSTGAAELDEDFWALKNISFEIKQGEVVGVIGRNGAGKSTLLKILSRIAEPTLGFAEIHGRVGTLLEVGTGFHPELSGRENTYLNGAILGMKKSEIECQFDEMVAFAEVEKFIDTPVKHYSSGMYLRLAFAVAAHLSTEVLLVDEVLAVGDAVFQEKCLDKMQDVAKQGRTVLFVSHNLAAVRALCTSTMLLEDGQLISRGPTKSVIQTYLSRTKPFSRSLPQERKARKGNGSARVLDFWMDTDQGSRLHRISCGDQVSLKILYQSDQPYRSLQFVISMYNELNQRVLNFDNTVTPTHVVEWPSSGLVSCKISTPFPLCPGNYFVNVSIFASGNWADYFEQALDFNVVAGDFYGTGSLPSRRALFFAQNKWELEKASGIPEIEKLSLSDQNPR